ncbi:MAG: metallophosphoesterase [Bacillota bacterium]|nr:metallophosphoesterase [Bacillota bacterium]
MLKKKWQKILLIPLASILLLGAVYFITVIIANNQDFGVTFYQVTSKKVNSRIRIVQLSDLHMHEFGKDNEELVDEIKRLKPNIIAVTGDMNNDYNKDYGVAITLCRRLVKIAPVYYSLGNNEYTAFLFKKSKILSDLKSVGVHIMHNKAEVVNIGNNPVQIIGISENGKGLRDTFGAKETTVKRFEKKFGEYKDGFKLLLIHYPEVFLNVMSDFDVDLALAGHAHGGQIRIPFIGGLYSPGEGFFPKLTEGYHVFKHNRLIISRGLGNSKMIPRINNKPELVVIDVNQY